jgi:hypothetical protein
MLLRLAVRAAGMLALGTLGFDVEAVDAGGGLLLLVDSQSRYSIKPGCTCIDHFLVLTSFIWRCRLPIGKNFARLIELFALVPGTELRSCEA